MSLSVYLVLAIIIMTAVTFALRALPFLIFKSSPILDYFGKFMPAGIMALLVVYSLLNVEFTQTPYGTPAIVAVISVVIVHHLWRKPLLSIVGGTMVHILLLQIM